MSKAVIEVKNLSKVYNIGHEQAASGGTTTLRDTLIGLARKPIELVTGHRLKREKFWALKNVSFTIEKGDVVGVLGRNGSGKSTILKILSRIVEPTEGEVRMVGKVASLLEVGTGFHPELTGRENIYFNGAILGMSQKEIKSKFNEIVEFSEVEKFLDTPVKFYSSGMYVRLAFSVAAHLDPDILIVDEVLAVGDAAFQKKCLGKMKDVAGQGRTVIFVSHNASTLRELCQKGILMSNGQVVMSGSIDEALNSYQASRGGDSFTYAAEKDDSKPAQILKVDISQKDKKSEGVYDSEEPISISIKYAVNKDLPYAALCLQIYSSDGSPLIASYANNISGLKQGSYSAEVVIPKHTLANKHYYIVAAVENPGVRTINASAEVDFDCYKDPDKSPKHPATGNFGYLSEDFAWRTKEA